MHPRKLVRDSVGFATTQYVVRAALMLRGVIAMRLLGPAAYGAWNALMLLLDYGTLAPLGTQQGLDQAVPARIVEGDPRRLERLERAGLFVIVAATLLFAVVTVAYLARSGTGQVLQSWGFAGLGVALACVLLMNVSNYHLTLLRSHGRIGAVGMWFVLQAAIGTVLGLSLIPFLGAWGLLWGWLAGTVVGLLYARAQEPGQLPQVPAPSRDSLLLLRIGLPMYLYVFSTLVMRNIDRVVILRFLGTEQLGYYALASMVTSFLLYLPDSIVYVFYPHLLRRYASLGARPDTIRDAATRMLKMLSLTMPALCGLAFLAAREGAFIVLPRFVPGVSAARLLCFGAGGAAIANLSSVVLMTLGRQKVLVPAALLVTALGAALDVMMVRLGYGITGVGWAMLGTWVTAGAVLGWLALEGLGVEPGRRVLLVARLLGPLAVSLALSYALDRLLPWRDVPGTGIRVARVLLGWIAFVAVYGAMSWPLLRGLGLKQLLLEVNVPGLGALMRRVAVIRG